MIRSVVKYPDPFLEKISDPVNDIGKVQHIICDLLDTLKHISHLYDFKRGHGLAAPQIGYHERINVVEYGSARHVLINPYIIDHSNEKLPIREGCLSFFNYRGNVPRYKAVTVKALNEKGESFTIDATNEFAMLLQHEIDHLDGILYIKRLSGGTSDLYPVENMPEIP